MNWNESKLKELGETLTGSTPNTADRENLGDYIPFIKPGDFESNGSLNYKNFGLSKIGSEKSRIIRKGSVLMVCIGATIGKVGFSDRDICTNQQINSINPNSGIDTKFLYYYMSTEDFKKRVITSSGQATMPIINKTKWSNLEVTYPPLPVQKQIVEKLDAAFADIDKAISATEKNIKNAEALFQSYLNTQFNKEDNLLPLKEVCELIKEQGKHKELPYVGMEDIESSTGRFLGGLNQKEMKSNTFKFNSNHLLYGRLRPYLNKVMLPDFEGHCSTEIFPILVNKNLQKEYLFYWLLNEETVNKINRTSTGTRMPRANFKEVIEFKLNIPGLNLQKEITERIKNIELELNNFKLSSIEKLNQLNSLKSSILNQAFSGELIKDAA